MSGPVDTRTSSTTAASVDATVQFASLLASGERVLVVRQRHWFTFIQAARWFVLALGAGVLIGLLNGEVPDGGVTGFVSTILSWGFWLFVLVGLVGVGWYYFAWRRERYLVTTRRVIESGGVINKWTRDTSLSMITDMVVGHPWIGRVLGFGELDLLTASEAGTNKIRFLPDADGFKKTLLDARYKLELELGGGAPQPAVAAAVPPAAAAPGPPQLSAQEVDDSITRLADMRDRGLITAEEFEEKKRELLGRL